MLLPILRNLLITILTITIQIQIEKFIFLNLSLRMVYRLVLSNNHQ